MMAIKWCWRRISCMICVCMNNMHSGTQFMFQWNSPLWLLSTSMDSMRWEVARMLKPLEELIHSPNPACCATKTRECTNPVRNAVTAQGGHAKNSIYSKISGLPDLPCWLSFTSKTLLLEIASASSTKKTYWGYGADHDTAATVSLQLALDGSKRKIPSGRHGRPALGPTKCSHLKRRQGFRPQLIASKSRNWLKWYW